MLHTWGKGSGDTLSRCYQGQGVLKMTISVLGISQINGVTVSEEGGRWTHIVLFHSPLQHKLFDILRLGREK